MLTTLFSLMLSTGFLTAVGTFFAGLILRHKGYLQSFLERFMTSGDAASTSSTLSPVVVAALEQAADQITDAKNRAQAKAELDAIVGHLAKAQPPVTPAA
jgi:hypothetical protein